jgi:hypothetical protein
VRRRIFFWNIVSILALTAGCITYDLITHPHGFLDPGWVFFCFATLAIGGLNILIGVLWWLFSIRSEESRWFLLAGFTVALIGGSVCAYPMLT